MERENNKDKNKETECLNCSVSPETLDQIKKAGERKKETVEKPVSSKKNIFPIITFLGGIFSGALGVVGAASLCSTVLISSVLGFLGISSILLMKYNIIFLIIGLVLIGLSIILFKKQKICKN